MATLGPDRNIVSCPSCQIKHARDEDEDEQQVRPQSGVKRHDSSVMSTGNFKYHDGFFSCVNHARSTNGRVAWRRQWCGH